MNKKKLILTVVMSMICACGAANAVPGPFGYDLQADMHRSEKKAQETPEAQQVQQVQQAEPASLVPIVKSAKDYYSFVPLKDLFVQSVDSTTTYYTNPTMKSAIARYKSGNYTGSLQELYAYIKKYPNDAYAYYYMGLNYTKIGENDAARNCFQKTINCNVSGSLLEKALKGRDCITGGEFCKPAVDVNAVKDVLDANNIETPESKLDKFINAPYSGNGFSPEFQQEYDKQKLDNIQKTLNRKDELNERDIEMLKEFKRKSKADFSERLALAANVSGEPTSAEIMDAIDVLKRAGLNITAGKSFTDGESRSTDNVSPENAAQAVNPNQYMPSQEYQQLNMMLGNNNNNDPMMTMLPYMMNNNNNGKNVDPQVIQAMMMNSMMNSLGSLNNSENK